MQASKREWEEFLKSSVWRDFRQELLLRRSDVRDRLEQGVNLETGTKLTVEEQEQERGRAIELKFMADFPDFVVSNWDNIIEPEGSEEGEDVNK